MIPRDEEFWTLLGSAIVLVWMAFVMPRCSAAQSGQSGPEGIRGTWTTYVEETRTAVWVVIDPPALVVVAMREGRCFGQRSRTRWDEEGRATNEALGWVVEADGDTLRADLPKTQATEARTMTYHRTTEQPSDICPTKRMD